VPLFVVLSIVYDGERHFIEKNRRGISEVYAVILEIGRRFAAVPLNLHTSTICTTVHTAKRRFAGRQQIGRTLSGVAWPAFSKALNSRKPSAVNSTPLLDKEGHVHSNAKFDGAVSFMRLSKAWFKSAYFTATLPAGPS
jgi:hypothetical protein